MQYKKDYVTGINTGLSQLEATNFLNVHEILLYFDHFFEPNVFLETKNSDLKSATEYCIGILA